MQNDLRWSVLTSEHFCYHLFGSMLCMWDLEHEILKHKLWMIKPVEILFIPLLVINLLPGLWFHRLFRQDGPVREDELDIEYFVRVWWVYTFSTAFLSVIVINIGYIIYYQAVGAQLAGLLLSILLSVTYVAGNMVLLHFMRRSNTLMTRMAAFAQINYGIAFVIALFLGLYDSYHRGSILATRKSAVAWFVRSIYALCMMSTMFGYRHILRLKYQRNRPKTFFRLIRASLMVLWSFYPIVLILICFFSSNADELWIAVAGA